MPNAAPRPTLLALATSPFGKLSLAEERLLLAGANGEVADCSELSGEDRIIRAKLFSWLCTNTDASAQVTNRGLSMVGAQIEEEVDLKWAKIPFSIEAIKCVFSHAILLSRSHITFLSLMGSSVKDLKANVARFETDVILSNGFKAEGIVDLINAAVGGHLDCGGGEFVAKDKGLALNANSAKIQGSIFLRNGFKAEGGVDLRAARIDGYLICDGGRFASNGKDSALNANHSNIRGVFLRKDFQTGKIFEAVGGVDLTAAKIDGDLDCDGGHFVAKDEGLALIANSAKIQGSISFRCGFKAEGGVDLGTVRIDGFLRCDGGQFFSKGKEPALNANGANIQRGVFLRKDFQTGQIFKAEGGVDFRASTIGVRLECDGGEFVGTDERPALNASSVNIAEHVYLRNGFKAAGGLDISAATIGGNLVCVGSQLVSRGKTPALNADGAKIDGNVFLRDGSIAEGEVRFVAAYVGRSFQWRGIRSPEKSILDLRFTKVAMLRNDQNSRPIAGNLRIDGLVYDQIDDEAPPNAKAQLGWLERQPQDRFLSQPYEQLAAVFRKMGLEEDARKVMIEKNKNQAAHLHWRPAWLWYGVVGKLIGYGYRPWRAFIISVIVIGIGWLVFDYGYNHDLVTPPEEKAYEAGTRQLTDLYPRFNAFVYSVETFVPFLKLGISEYWIPNATRPPPPPSGNQHWQMTAGGLLRGYLWCHIIAGWVLTTLWVGGLTKLVKT
jgi:hypothetical protein